MMKTETIVLPKDKVVNEANVNIIIRKRCKKAPLGCSWRVTEFKDTKHLTLVW